MPLVNCLYPPDGERGLAEWSFSHAQDHIEIIQGIRNILGINRNIYILDPVNWNDRKGFLLLHQAAHTDMNQVLQLPGQDLQSVDFDKPDQSKAWFFQQFTEHQNARARLGI